MDQPASDFIGEWRGSEKADISIKQLLQMRAGIGDPGTLFSSFGEIVPHEFVHILPRALAQHERFRWAIR